MTTRVLVPLAEGFEEIETVTIVDVLRRAELDVTLAGLTPGSGARLAGDTRRGGRQLGIGRPLRVRRPRPAGRDGGTLNMMEEESLLAALRAGFEAGKVTAAICAAPLVLQAAGVVEERSYTAHPSVHDRLSAGALERGERVVRSGNLLTSQGPGTAMEFALALVEELAGPERARELSEAMVVGQAG